jgi:hypothetical protein
LKDIKAMSLTTFSSTTLGQNSNPDSMTSIEPALWAPSIWDTVDELVDFLIRVARPRLGPHPILHILIPAVSQLAITESLTFPDEIGPYRVSGQLGDTGIPNV